MLWTVAVVLFVLWAVGLFAFHVGGGLIHALIVVAVHPDLSTALRTPPSRLGL